MKLLPSLNNYVGGLASILGCAVASLPMKYLSISLGSPFMLGEFSSHTIFEVGDDSKLDSGMTSGVGIRSLRIFSRICIVLLA